MKSNLLVEAIRGSTREKYFDGWIIVVDKYKRILKTLEYSNSRCYMRSCEKPLQALALFNLGLYKKFNFEYEDIALSYASHSGSKEHINRLKALACQLNIHESQLLCGTHMPLDKDERYRLIKASEDPGVFHNNCSAKHLFILAACVLNGWDTETYIDFNHPIQLHINEIIKEFCQIEYIDAGIDGCSMPIHAMKLEEMGAGFAKFFDGENAYASIIADAVSQYPFYAGGKGRIDSSIIFATKGRLLAKVGAEGLIIVSPKGSGESLVIKVASGDDYIRNKIVIEALLQLNWLNELELEFIPDEFIDKNIYNHAGKTVGNYIYHFKI